MINFTDLINGNLTQDNKFIENELNNFKHRLRILSYFGKKNQQLPNLEQVK